MCEEIFLDDIRNKMSRKKILNGGSRKQAMNFFYQNFDHLSIENANRGPPENH